MFYPSIVFIIKRNYIYIGNTQKSFFDKNSFYFVDSKLLNNFNSAIHEKDMETALNNDEMKFFSYICEEPAKFIKDPNLLERETKIIENFIHQLYSGTQIYHEYNVISKETENLDTNTLGEKRIKENAEKIFNSFLNDFL